MPAIRLQESEAEVTAKAGTPVSSPRSWPDAVAYREAIQNPTVALSDAELATGMVRTDRRGLPVAYSGRFAVVFRLGVGRGEWAVRCFTSPDTGATGARAAHYAALQQRIAALRAAGHPAASAFVPFRYLPDGVRVGRERYPLLAMRWAEGETLLPFVERHRTDPGALLRLCAALGRLLADLEAAGIAHGDWQHDNLVVSNGGATVTLVDYDGVLLPGGEGAPERGHPNYQHPARRAGAPSPTAARTASPATSSRPPCSPWPPTRRSGKRSATVIRCCSRRPTSTIRRTVPSSERSGSSPTPIPPFRPH